MTEAPVFLDASFFLGMHDVDADRRRVSIAYFTRNLSSRPRMNHEQIGICDAVIWKASREIQDMYYPFMDRLHTDMAIDRAGYGYRDIAHALDHPQLAALRPDRAFLVGQTLVNRGVLATHDPVLRALDCLQGSLWTASTDGPPSSFPPDLQALYDASRAFAYLQEAQT